MFKIFDRVRDSLHASCSNEQTLFWYWFYDTKRSADALHCHRVALTQGVCTLSAV